MDLRRIYFYRYGTERQPDKVYMSYPQIARLLYVPVSTVWRALKRYE